MSNRAGARFRPRTTGLELQPCDSAHQGTGRRGAGQGFRARSGHLDALGATDATLREALRASALEVVWFHRIQERQELLDLSFRHWFLSRRRQIARLLDHLFGGEDRCAGAHREGNRV